jgi:hypothetical protein
MKFGKYTDFFKEHWWTFTELHSITTYKNCNPHGYQCDNLKSNTSNDAVTLLVPYKSC